MLNHESLLTSITMYGLCVLFVKAWLIVLLSQSFYEQCEFSSASMRHSIWMAALLALFILPLLTFLLPSWNIPFFSFEVDHQNQAVVSNDTKANSFTMGVFVKGIIIVYLLVTALLLLRLIAAIIEITLITFSAKPVDDSWHKLIAKLYPKRNYKIKISHKVETPLTWGVLSPQIIVPERAQYWTEQERRMVLQHECSHIHRADWLMQILGQFVCILYWPVPGIHSALDKLSLEAEQACDDNVLGQGVNAADYAHLLLRQATIKKLQASVSFGQPSEFSCRVRHIISVTVNRAGEKKMKCLLLVVSAAIMLPYASLQATIRSPQDLMAIESLKSSNIVVSKKEELVAARLPKTLPPILRPVKPMNVSMPPARSSDLILEEIVVKSKYRPLENQAIEVASLGSLPLPVESLNIQPAKKVVSQYPKYPSRAAMRGIEGVVMVEFTINKQGEVQDPHIIYAQPKRIFNRAVLNALQVYRFKPQLVNDQAVSIRGWKEEFRFKLVDSR